MFIANHFNKQYSSIVRHTSSQSARTKKIKDPADSASLLLLPAIKVMERFLLLSLTDHLPVADVQHGFRSEQSTVTALNNLNQAISGCFNQKKPAKQTVLRCS